MILRNRSRTLVPLHVEHSKHVFIRPKIIFIKLLGSILALGFFSISMRHQSLYQEPNRSILRSVGIFDVYFSKRHVEQTNLTDNSCQATYGLKAFQVWDPEKHRSLLSQSTVYVNGAQISCASTTIADMPSATAPHTFCYGRNIVLNNLQAHPARCLKHRPGYLCDGAPTYFNYESGFIGGQCPTDSRIDLKLFPRDHLKDIFDSWRCDNDPTLVQEVREGLTLIVNRERGEHANFFHAMTDLLNAFVTLALVNADPKSTSILLFDDHPPGPFDDLWKALVERYPVTRLNELPDTVKLDSVAFVPPGYSNVLYRKLNERRSCSMQFPRSALLYSSFAKYCVDRLNVEELASSSEIVVLFMVRKPFKNTAVDHSKFIGRQIVNQDELIEGLRAHPMIDKVEVVDFATISIARQVSHIRRADILIGMHGAGLTHVIFMRPGSALLELRPKPNFGWWVFERLAMLSGVAYDDWVNNEYPRNFRKDEHGDYTRVNVEQILEAVSKLAQRVINARST